MLKMATMRNKIISDLMSRPKGRDKQVGGTGSISKGKIVNDGKENDQYDTANVPHVNQVNPFRKRDPMETWNMERNLAMDATDNWEVENAKRNGEYGSLVQDIAKEGDRKAAKSIYRDEWGKPLTKEAIDKMPQNKKLLLQRMIEQKVADKNGTIPRWVSDLDNRYDLGYRDDDPMTSGTGYRNGKRTR